jgi:hypothetical protein
MTSQEVPSVLAVEVPTNRAAPSAERPPSINPSNSQGEPDLGTGAHCQRVETEVRHPGFASHGRQVSGSWPTPKSRSAPALADLHTKSRPGDGSLRLLRRDHSPIPYPLCIRSHGTGPAQNPALHCHRSPSAEWTLQQLREALPDDHSFRFLIHDRDSIFSLELDKAVAAMGVRILRLFDHPKLMPDANV